MIPIPSKRLLIIGATLTVIPITCTYLSAYFYKKKLKKIHEEIKRKESLYYYHCVFITMDNSGCRRHIYEGDPCGENCSYHTLNRIVGFINSARHSVSICMYTMSLKQVTEAVLAAHQRGVAVRVITDRVMVKLKTSKWSQLNRIYKIPVKIPSDVEDTIMHHKFCLIDEKQDSLAKLLTGSLNMTLQGICSNFEFILFTNNSQMIRAFSKEFDKLWDELKVLEF